MTANTYHSEDPTPTPALRAVGDLNQIPDLVRHLTFALSAYVRRSHHEGLLVPREVEQLTSFLAHIARTRQYPPIYADGRETRHDAHMPDRLLITKGEVAERLSVSVRTIERLVATGRLPQVYVERSARFRVTDLETYVNSLMESHSVVEDEVGAGGEP